MNNPRTPTTSNHKPTLLRGHPNQFSQQPWNAKKDSPCMASAHPGYTSDQKNLRSLRTLALLSCTSGEFHLNILRNCPESTHPGSSGSNRFVSDSWLLFLIQTGDQAHGAPQMLRDILWHRSISGLDILSQTTISRCLQILWIVTTFNYWYSSYDQLLSISFNFYVICLIGWLESIIANLYGDNWL